jgi:pilus assembly protein CpaB
VLQNVVVMATGQRAADDPAGGERRLYTTVTLDTDPQQARNLVLARESGRLTALLRNPEDAQPVAGAVTDLAQWLSPDVAPASVARSGDPQPRGVPVLYGGRSSSLAADAAAVRLPPPAAAPAQAAAGGDSPPQSTPEPAARLAAAPTR